MPLSKLLKPEPGGAGATAPRSAPAIRLLAERIKQAVALRDPVRPDEPSNGVIDVPCAGPLERPFQRPPVETLAGRFLEPPDHVPVELAQRVRRRDDREVPEQARSSTRQFVEALFSSKPEELRILIWTLADRGSRWFSDVESAIRYAESASGQDVYIGVGLSGRDYGADHRCPSSEIAAIGGLWADIDLRSDAHPKTTLPCTVEEALSILPTDLPLTFIIFTGNGIHVWLLFRELYLFRNEEDRVAAAVLAKRWNTLIRDNARMRGWHIDRLSDLARILRIPGTTNCKDPANPKAVVIQMHSDHRYTPSDLAKYFEDIVSAPRAAICP